MNVEFGPCTAAPKGVSPWAVQHSRILDLKKHFEATENALAYLFFRFWSDEEQDVNFALSAGSGGEFFFEGRRICEIEPFSDAAYLAPEIVPVVLKRGYNVLVAKIVKAPAPMQYRNAWEARAQAFTC